MAVNCQSAVEAGGSSASERNQSPMVEDAAAMTIEFLRARLLSERAASRTARQQAQQIAEKVSELQSRLDMEIELRKKAEAAAEKVFAVLKTKGLSTEHFMADDCKPLQTEKNGSEEGFISPDDSKEVVDSEQQLCDGICRCIDEQGEVGLEFKMLERHSQIGNETALQGQSVVGNGDAQCDYEELLRPCKEDEKVYNPKETEKEFNVNGNDKDCEVQDAVNNAIGEKKQESSSEHCEKMKGQPSEPAGKRQVIAQKLTAMLQQIEKEVETLSEGEPQKLQLQGWVDHSVSVLESKEPSLNSGIHGADSGTLLYSEASFPMQQGPEDTQADENKTLGESESLKHAEGLLRLAGKVNAELAELVQKKVNGKQASSHSLKGDYTNGSEIGVGSLDWPSTLMDQSQMPMYSTHYNSWRSYSTHYPVLGMSQTAHARRDCMGTQRSYPAELQSPRDLGDSLKSDSDKERPVYGQWQDHGCLSQSKSPVSESSTEHPHVSVMEVHPHVSVTDDLLCDTIDANIRLYGKQEMQSSDTTFVGHINREFKSRHPYHANTAYYQGRVPLVFSRTREGFGFNLPTQRHTRAPVSDMARTLIDDKNGRIGDILTALHLAKLQVKDEEQLLSHPEDKLGPSTPTSGRGKPYIRYHEDDWRQLPYEDHPRRSEGPQTPIVQFPSSPSPGRRFSALDRHDGLIRSNSVSPAPTFEADIQPSGKVHLGNGITLYTD